MTRSKRAKGSEKEKSSDKKQVKCYYCNEMVKSSALRCPHCGKFYSSGKQAVTIIIVVLIAICLVSVYYFHPFGEQNPYLPSSQGPTVIANSPTGFSEPVDSRITVTFSRDMDRNSVQSAFAINPDVPGAFSWNGNTMSYIPTIPLEAGIRYSVTIRSTAMDSTGRHLSNGTFEWYFTTARESEAELRTIGTGAEQFWDISVTHPAWASSAALAKPVLIFTHSEESDISVLQSEIYEAVIANYISYITHYDLLSGTDEPMATNSFDAYDPDGEPHDTQLIVILTKGPDNTIIWHSWEGVVTEATLSSWVEDAITYHEQY